VFNTPVVKQMKHLRIATGLEKLLMNCFDQPNARLERKVIQSSVFRNQVIAKWADWCIKENRLIDSSGIPKLPELCAVNQTTPEIAWMLERIVQGPKALNSEFSSFPSILSRTGPQFPFTHSQFDHLRKRAGGLKGTEMTQPIEVLPKPLHRLARRKQREEDLSVYKWRVEDDDDNFVEDPINPKSTQFYPNSY
jgi:hypothetical protein